MKVLENLKIVTCPHCYSVLNYEDIDIIKIPLAKEIKDKYINRMLLSMQQKTTFTNDKDYSFKEVCGKILHCPCCDNFMMLDSGYIYYSK